MSLNELTDRASASKRLSMFGDLGQEKQSDVLQTCEARIPVSANKYALVKILENSIGSRIQPPSLADDDVALNEPKIPLPEKVISREQPAYVSNNANSPPRGSLRERSEG